VGREVKNIVEKRGAVSMDNTQGKKFSTPSGGGTGFEGKYRKKRSSNGRDLQPAKLNGKMIMGEGNHAQWGLNGLRKTFPRQGLFGLSQLCKRYSATGSKPIGHHRLANRDCVSARFKGGGERKIGKKKLGPGNQWNPWEGGGGGGSEAKCCHVGGGEFSRKRGKEGFPG